LGCLAGAQRFVADRPVKPQLAPGLLTHSRTDTRIDQMNELSDWPTVPAVGGGLPGTVELGAFSISLTVANLAASRAFYERLGFIVVGGAEDANYLILKNGESTLGLFFGMFDRNILTFNPGLTNRMERLETYTDVRDIQGDLEKAGLELTQRADPTGKGPASVTLVDPDGNPVLIDQFF
jgi:catechol 2,3-dioxygenase-like lactoylglutathione lyase family enzyme